MVPPGHGANRNVSSRLKFRLGHQAAKLGGGIIDGLFTHIVAHGEALRANERYIRNPDKTEQRAQMRFLRVERLGGSLAVKPAAAFHDDGALPP